MKLPVGLLSAGVFPAGLLREARAFLPGSWIPVRPPVWLTPVPERKYRLVMGPANGVAFLTKGNALMLAKAPVSTVAISAWLSHLEVFSILIAGRERRLSR